jgi:hypothetical protein
MVHTKFQKKYEVCRVNRVESWDEKCHTNSPLKEINSYGKEN